MSTTENPTSGASGMAEQQAEGLLGSDVREGYAEIGDQRLHYMEAGDGPLVVLLHGFPEFWYGWRLQVQPLAAAGFRVVAPDVPSLDHVERLPDASHWVHHDEHERVTQQLTDFFAPALAK